MIVMRGNKVLNTGFAIVLAVSVAACNTAAKKKIAEQYDSPDKLKKLTPAKMLDIGFQYYKIGDTGKAIDIAKYCIYKNYSRSDAYVLLGKCYYVKKDYRKARAALEMAGNNGEAYLTLSSVALDEGNVSLALASLKRVPWAGRNNAVYYLNWGDMYNAVGEYKRAAFCYIQAINLNPKFVNAYKRLLHTCKRSRDDALAKRAEELYAVHKIKYGI